MNQAVRSYFLAITAVCLLYTIVMAITPKGTIRLVGELVGGMLLILVSLSPLIQIDTDNIASAITQYALKSDMLKRDIEIGNRELMCQVITQKCETYILDKAGKLGFRVNVQVYLDEDAEIPHPVRAVLQGKWTEADQAVLSKYIAEELGIPAERQEWIWM